MLVYFFLGVLAFVVSFYSQKNWLFWIGMTVCFTLYFGLNDLFSLILFMLGLVFLIIEVYIPDFGVTGLVGILTIVFSLWLKYRDIQPVVIISLVTLAMAILIFMVLSKAGYNLRFSPQFVLKHSISHPVQGEKCPQLYLDLVGQKAMTVSGLRPVGRIKVNEEYFEAYSIEGMIEANQRVEIVKIQDKKIFVRSEFNESNN